MGIATSPNASAEPPRLAPWTGLALLALWLGWLVPAFLALFDHARPAEDAAGIVARVQAAVPSARDLAGPTAFLASDAPGCRCTGDAPAADLHDALHRAVTAVTATDAGIGYPVVVLAPPGRLVYAGPARVDTGCGRPLPLATLLPALLSTSRQALIVPVSPCHCSKEP